MFHRKNLIIIGLLLLVVFAGAVWLVGVQIDTAAKRMHRSMVWELAEYRSELIRQDFGKTEKLAQGVRDFLNRKGYDKKELTAFMTGLMKLDEKVNRVWFIAGDDCVVCSDSAGACDFPSPGSLPITEGSGLHLENGMLYWTLYGRCNEVVYGFDVSLADLHAYFADLTPGRRNYVYILNESGVFIAYPDDKQVGVSLADTCELKRIEEVIRENKLIQMSGFSHFLLLPVDRVYCPITVGSEKWVVVVDVLQIDNQEAMADFHRYAFFIAVITVIIFSILLSVSQYKWRKEYDLRRKVEQEALQLNLQQLKNQLNPHFLFNSFNSLSALIGCDPVTAKEFVLKLSKVYRYVLDKRNENLATVRDELEFTRHYYFLQKIRFGDQLMMEIESGIDETDGKIPAMSLQMLIENAIKHNEITRLHPLRIRIYRSGSDLVVENGYRPRTDESSDSLGIGFENICKIYEFYSKEKFVYTIERDLFVCKLPLLNN